MSVLSKYRGSNDLPVTLRNDLFLPFERVFDDFFTDFFRGTSVLDKVKAQSGYPKMDITTNNNELVVRAAIPGVKQEDVQVEMIDDQTVEISGRVSDEYSSYNESYHLKELTKRSFARRIVFNDKLGDPQAAIVKDGILTLKWSIPQTKEPDKRVIAVKQG